MTAPIFCALCTSERGPFVERPLGRGDALVNVCEECDDTHPRNGRYAFEGKSEPSRCGAIMSNNGNRRSARRG